MSNESFSGDALSMFDRLDMILEAVEEDGFLTLSGVTERTGMARSTTHRLLTQMERRRWLFRVGNNYEIGPRLFTLGTKGLRNHWFYRRVLPTLHWLHEQSGYVVHLAWLDGPEVVCWEKLGSGAFSLKVPTRIGGRMPYTSAAGKALLASQDHRVVERLSRLSQVTPNGFSTSTELHSELNAVRKKGYAVDESGCVPGVGCFAATIEAGTEDTPSTRRTTVAVSVCVPMERLESRLVPILLSAKRQIIRNTKVNPMTDPSEY